MCAESNVELKDTTTIVIGTMAGGASKPDFGSALPAMLVPKSVPHPLTLTWTDSSVRRLIKVLKAVGN